MGGDDDALDAGGDFERVVLHVLAGPAEDRVQELLFRRQLERDSWATPCRRGCRRGGRRCRCDHPVLVEVRSALGGTFGMSRVNSSLPSFVSRISMSNSSMWIEVYVSFFTSRSLDDDRVLEVVTLPGHERDQHVAAERSSPFLVAARRR